MSSKSKAQAQTGNRFGSEGEGALAEALKVNTTLTTLQLDGQNNTMNPPKHGVLCMTKKWSQTNRKEANVRRTGRSAACEHGLDGACVGLKHKKASRWKEARAGAT